MTLKSIRGIISYELRKGNTMTNTNETVNIIVMDTETVGGKNRHLLDVGYYLVELKGTERTVLKTFNYLVEDVIDNKYFMENDMFINLERYHYYLEMLKARTIKKVSFKRLMKMIDKDISKYNAKFLYAYNSTFDAGVFKEDCKYHGLPNPLEKIQVIDLYAQACSCLLNTKEYYNWAIENNQITKSGNFLASGVEPLTKYLNQDIDFVEEHRALSDSYHELQILYKMLDMGKDIFSTTDKIKKVKLDIRKQERVQINNVMYIIDYKKITNFKDRKVYYDSTITEE